MKITKQETIALGVGLDENVGARCGLQPARRVVPTPRPFPAIGYTQGSK